MDELIKLIPYGSKRALTRQQLIDMTGMSDRAIRNTIAKARRSGDVIIATSDNKGYFRPFPHDVDDVEKVRHFVAEQLSRANSIKQATEGAKLWLDTRMQEKMII